MKARPLNKRMRPRYFVQQGYDYAFKVTKKITYVCFPHDIKWVTYLMGDRSSYLLANGWIEVYVKYLREKGFNKLLLPDS